MVYLFFILLVGFSAPAFSDKGLPMGDWIAQGFTEQQREDLQDVIQKGIDEKFVPGGAFLIMHQGKVIFREAFGLAEIETNRKMTVEDVFFIASITKPFTSTTMAILADQGVISLDDQVDQYLPAFKSLKVRELGDAKRAPTIRECLSHTAGFPGNRDLQSGAFFLKLDGSLEEAVNDLATKELWAEPGRAHAYGRFGYMTAARVAEVLTHKEYEQVMQEVLLQKIGAVHSTFYPSKEVFDGMVKPYVRVDGGFKLREGSPLGRTINPGGSLFSTLDDVGRLLLLHRNKGLVDGKQIVSEDVLRELYKPQPHTPGNGYGLGFNTLKKEDGRGYRLQHIGGSGTLIWVDLKADVLFAMLTQVPTPQMIKYRRQVLRKVAEIFVTEN